MIEVKQPRGVRKATLTKKAAEELRLKIDYVLQGEARRRLGLSAVNFLGSIRRSATGALVRLSKKQRDTTEEILARALSDVPVVILEGESIVHLGRLFNHATADGRVSVLEENLMANLKHQLTEPMIALSEKQWRMIEGIARKTYFGLPGESPPIDQDGLLENDDPDGQPTDRNGMDRTRDEWASVGVYEDAD
jgi:hypothetical protein